MCLLNSQQYNITKNEKFPLVNHEEWEKEVKLVRKDVEWGEKKGKEEKLRGFGGERKWSGESERVVGKARELWDVKWGKERGMVEWK